MSEMVNNARDNMRTPMSENLDWRLASAEDRLTTYYSGDPTIGYPPQTREAMIRDELAENAKTTIGNALTEAGVTISP